MELIMNNLNVIWFILLCVLFAGFFFLEGFDYGTGILLPVIGKTDVERRQMINALGPIWDGNEVWMITAGGALFASFPHVYATLFSGFYMALFLMLAVLIMRGVAFEFRSKSANRTWRKVFDYCIFIGSIVPALLWGVTVGNLIQGTPIDETMTYVGTFWDLLSPYTVLCGVAFILVFTYHGGLFTSIKVFIHSSCVSIFCYDMQTCLAVVRNIHLCAHIADTTCDLFYMFHHIFFCREIPLSYPFSG